MEGLSRYCCWALMFLAIFILCCTKAQAFWCVSDGVNTGDNTSKIFTKSITISPTEFNKTVNDITLTNMGSYAKCHGGYGPWWKDSLRAVSLTLAPALTERGYVGYISSYGSAARTIPPELCLWPDQFCTVRSSNDNEIRSLNTIISMKRNAGVGRWGPGLIMKAGTEIARLNTRMSSMHTPRADVVWIFKLQNDLNLAAYTCNVDNNNKKVTLEDARLSDIISQGAGRYTGKVTEFSYLLTCDSATSVSVKLEGTPLSSSSGPINNVLANTVAATKNIGVQVLFDNTPMSVIATDPAVTVINSAQASETLKFKAYYYYNGGSGTTAGPVNSSTAITFDYF